MRILLITLSSILFSGMAFAFEDIHPFPDGTTGKWLFTVTGIRAHTASGTFDVAFNCTNMDKSKNAVIGVEIYSYNGELRNDISASNGVLTISPGMTGTFETNSIEALSGDEIINNVSVGQGVARIVSSNPKIICNAYLMGDTGNTPTIAAIPVVKGTVQK